MRPLARSRSLTPASLARRRFDSSQGMDDHGITMNAMQEKSGGGGGGGRGATVVHASYDDQDEFTNLRRPSNANTEVMDFANFGEGSGSGFASAHPQPHVNEAGLLDLRPDHVAHHDLPITQHGAKSGDVVIGI